MSKMTAVGIIAEYNPFHKGHAYHIEQSKKITDSECAIVVMSGNFVQRGEPAIMDKYLRANLAIQNGADLVVELPVVSATGSSQIFARGAIGILSKLFVNHLCFGSETGDIAPFETLANAMFLHQDDIDKAIHDWSAKGISYASARQNAIESILGYKLETILPNMPNNILGLEYLLEVKKQHASIIPHTIMRVGNDYHDTTPGKIYSSATAIRQMLLEHNNNFYQDIPTICHDTLAQYLELYRPLFLDDFTDVIRYKLMSLKNQSSTLNIADLSIPLFNKLYHALNDTTSVSSLIEATKSKDLTYTRISRALIHLLLDISVNDYQSVQANPCSYVRVLGFSDFGKKYLASIKKEIQCPIIVKPANNKELLTKDIQASDIYNSILSRKSGKIAINDFQRQIQ